MSIADTVGSICLTSFDQLLKENAVREHTSKYVDTIEAVVLLRGFIAGVYYQPNQDSLEFIDRVPDTAIRQI